MGRTLYRNASLFMFLFTAPFLLMEQIDFLCFHRDSFGECINAVRVVIAKDIDQVPNDSPHDDEEAELVSLCEARDEEEEEKPLKRRRPEEEGRG